MVEELTKDSIENKIKQNKPIIIDFYGDWCAPCKSFAPTFEKVSKDFKDINFAKFDIDNDEKVTAIKLDIRSVPTLIFFNKGEEINRSTGNITEEELRNKIKEFKEKCH